MYHRIDVEFIRSCIVIASALSYIHDLYTFQWFCAHKSSDDVTCCNNTDRHCPTVYSIRPQNHTASHEGHPTFSTDF